MILVLIVVVFLTGATLVVCGNKRWTANVKRLQEEIRVSSKPTLPGRYSAEELERLPEFVQRFFRVTLGETDSIVREVYIEHMGTFNLSEDGENWRPFESAQYVTPRRPGFVWDARINVLPLVNIYVCDAYVQGEGLLCAKALGLVPIMRRSGSAELAQGELMRFLAESLWYPTSLLPSQGIVWEGLDYNSARATLRDNGFSVSMTFVFDERGLVSSVIAADRYREIDGKQVPCEWQGRFWNYRRCGKMLVPFEGEASWILGKDIKPYWRGMIKKIEYRS